MVSSNRRSSSSSLPAMILLSEEPSCQDTNTMKYVTMPSNDDDDDDNDDGSDSSSSTTFWKTSCMKKTPQHKQEQEQASFTSEKTKRKVSFKTSSRVRVVVAAKDLVDGKNEKSIKEVLWYQPLDYQRMHQKALAIVKAIDSDDFSYQCKRKNNTKKLCTRGLERHFNVNKDHVSEVRRLATIAVLEVQEQHHQQNHHHGNGIDDDEAAVIIAYAYHRYTYKAQRKANIVGQSDEREVAKYLSKR